MSVKQIKQKKKRDKKSLKKLSKNTNFFSFISSIQKLTFFKTTSLATYQKTKNVKLAIHLLIKTFASANSPTGGGQFCLAPILNEFFLNRFAYPDSCRCGNRAPCVFVAHRFFGVIIRFYQFSNLLKSLLVPRSPAPAPPSPSRVTLQELPTDWQPRYPSIGEDRFDSGKNRLLIEEEEEEETKDGHFEGREARSEEYHRQTF